MILLNFDIHPELQILMILLKQSSVQKKFALIVRDNSMQGTLKCPKLLNAVLSR